ncbi:MAG TPA: SWIM zinc finger family protein [Longimicrobiales bacterium]
MMERPGIPARIDLHAAGGVDPQRLERSLGLHVRRVGRGRYRVWGGREPHWVDLYTRRLPRCDCGDHLWRERVCKHILAVMLREGDERVIGAVGRLVSRLRLEARRERRRRRD